MSLFKSLFSAIAMQALILAPTRELAQQIQKVAPNSSLSPSLSGASEMCLSIRNPCVLRSTNKLQDSPADSLLRNAGGVGAGRLYADPVPRVHRWHQCAVRAQHLAPPLFQNTLPAACSLPMPTRFSFKSNISCPTNPSLSPSVSICNSFLL